MTTLMADLWHLSKPRVVAMLLVTTLTGFIVGAGGLPADRLAALFFALLGTGLAAGGSAMLNNYLERDSDALMKRTRQRALPAGRVEPELALGVGVLLVLGGVTVLAALVNLLSAFLLLIAAFIYVIVYTPLKKITWLNTPIGAIPGALPAMIGWTAFANNLHPGAWVLFFILFLWQHPHFFAIAWMYREDYGAAGYKMLPVIDPTGARAFRQAVLFSLALIPVSIALSALGLAGRTYLIGAIFLGAGLLAASLTLAQHRKLADARRVLFASLMYLPLLLVLIVVDIGLTR